jgi:CPA2 family monovalent cation:H+ antiporter-2
VHALDLILSIIANPLLYRLIPVVDAQVARRPVLSRVLNGSRPRPGDLDVDEREGSADTGHAVVVGYGPCGETATRLLRENGVSVTVVELNTETVRRLRQQKIDVLARVGRLTDVAAARQAGADGVFSGEAEVAMAFTEEILRRLGAPPEQVDRERARVRRLGAAPGCAGRAAVVTRIVAAA